MTGFGLGDDEARTVADTFGVAIEQVRRDHLISHILAALSVSHADRVIFFGGTALARTALPAGRLSEDIDLIATGARRETAAAIEQTLERTLRRSHGRISWAPRLTAVRNTAAAVLLAKDGQLAVRIQLLDHVGYPPWPTEFHSIEQRYTDAGPATLRVPTAPAFAAWKTVAWHDRGAARDPLGSVGAGRTRRDHQARGRVVHRARPDRQGAAIVDVHLRADRGTLAGLTGRPDAFDRQRERRAHLLTPFEIQVVRRRRDAGPTRDAPQWCR